MNAMPRRRAMVPVKLSTTMLGAAMRGPNMYPGGLDLTTPALALQNGALRDGVNYEVSVTGGYARIAGYERYDGQDAPSDASYVVVQVAAFTNVPAVGDAITQAGSGATGTVAAVNDVTDAYYMVVTQVAGTFNDSGAITKAGPTAIGTATATTVSLTAQQQAQYTNAAADIYRALIGAVPGSGAILGVVAATFNSTDFVYAFRNNAGGTAVDLYQASAAGWVQIPFYNTVEFTAGGAAIPADGETLTQGGVTATIKRVMTRSGPSWTGSAAGAFVVTNPSGGNFAAGAATTSGGSTLTLSGAQAAIVLLPDGRFQFDKGNFSGQDTTQRVYGCDGVNKCFEFDGETLAPITTGLAFDAPSNIQCHYGHLFVSFESSVLYSGPGTPFLWGATDGGGEIATGDTITALKTLIGSQSTGSLSIYHLTGMNVLYGTDDSNWSLADLSTVNGAHRYSVQNLFDTFVFDDLGVITLQSTLNFGNFASGALTSNILPFIVQNRTRVSASTINRTKSQYRVFFSNGYGLWLTAANQRYLGAIPVFFPNPVNVVDETTTSQGEEVSYFGSTDDDGYVYQLDKGSSFDGAAIDAFITLAWEFLKSPRIEKRFRRGSIEVQGDSWVQIAFGYQLGYGTPQINQPAAVNYETDFSAAPLWDEFTWDEFTWDGQTLTPTTVDLTGTAENIQITLSTSTDYILPFTVNSVIYQYSMRRQMR